MNKKFFPLLTTIVSVAMATSVRAEQTEPAAQTPDARCGSHCLMTALMAMDCNPASFEELEDLMGAPAPEGYSLLQLQDAARQYGAYASAVRTSPDGLVHRTGRFTCIALLHGNHFAIVADIRNGIALVADPPRSYEIPLDQLLQDWDGTALLVSDQPLQSEESVVASLKRSHMIRSAVIVLAGWCTLLAVLGAMKYVRTAAPRREIPELTA